MLLKVAIISYFLFSNPVLAKTNDLPIEIKISKKATLNSEKNFLEIINKNVGEDYQLYALMTVRSNESFIHIASLNLENYCSIIFYKESEIQIIFEEPFCVWSKKPFFSNKLKENLIYFPMKMKAYSDDFPGDSEVSIKINTDPLGLSF
ncbi:hypothetical protein [Comamonas sp. NoAH]|uniref:hypothetical protein n=1 Tax=Comamonas halotolerans TaxID=3041496 RepID=UPI0024E0F712|nr:hypothetical protein [Comamonas sp. NoAH]